MRAAGQSLFKGGRDQIAQRPYLAQLHRPKTAVHGPTSGSLRVLFSIFHALQDTTVEFSETRDAAGKAADFVG